MIFGVGLTMYGFGVFALILATREAFSQPSNARNMAYVAVGWLVAAAILFAVVRADRIVGG